MKTLFPPFAVVLVCVGFLGQSHAELLDDDSDSILASFFGGKFDPWADPTSNDFAPATAGDSDLGDQFIVLENQDYDPFRFELTQKVRWTDNAVLSDLDIFTGLEDTYSATDLRFTYLPRISDNTYFEFSTGYALYRYMDYSSLDFDRLETSVGLIHRLQDLDNLIVWTRLESYQLFTPSLRDNLLTDNTLEAGLYYSIHRSSRHKAFGAYSAKFSLDTNPDRLRRHEHWLSAGYSYSPTDRYEISAYVGVHLHDYLDNGRTDLLYDTRLSLTSHLTEHLDVILSANYTWNDSNTAGFDYEVADIGANLGFTLKF